MLRREFLSERQRVPPAEKKTTLVKMLAKLIITSPRPGTYSHFFSHDLKELDILVRSSAGIILMYYSFAFVTTNLRPAVYLQIRLQSPRIRIHEREIERDTLLTTIAAIG